MEQYLRKIIIGVDLRHEETGPESIFLTQKSKRATIIHITPKTLLQ